MANEFVILELTGLQRRVVLTGRAMPERPYRLRGAQRIETTWSVGVPVASAQVLGAEEQPTTISGWWMDRYLGALGVDTAVEVGGVALVEARQVAALFDDVRRQGQQLEVAWDGVVRIGHLTQVEISHHTREDIEWSLTFTWLSYEGERVVPVVVPLEAGLGAMEGAIEQPVRAMEEIELPPLPIPPAAGSALRDAIAKARQVADAVRGTIASTVQNILSPLAAAQRMQALMSEAISAGLQVISALTSESGAGMVFGVAQVDLLLEEVLAAEEFSRDMVRAARELARVAAEARAQYTARLGEDVLQVYQLREGEDLRRVAQALLGDAGAWRTIASFNDFATSLPPAGSLIYIPRPRQQ